MFLVVNCDVLKHHVQSTFIFYSRPLSNTNIPQDDGHMWKSTESQRLPRPKKRSLIDITPKPKVSIMSFLT